MLARVTPAGPTCHTLERTCFGEEVEPPGGVLLTLDATLAERERERERPEGSYTVRLLEDENLRLKKLGEEASELVAALAKGDAERAVEDGGDLLYHVLVALRAQGVDAPALLAALAKRAR